MMKRWSTVDAIKNITQKIEEQTTSQKSQKLNQDHLMMNQIQSQLNDDQIELIHNEQPSHIVQDQQLIYFNFTDCLSWSLSSSTSTSTTTTTTRRLLINVIISLIEKYGANNIKLYANRNNKHHDMIHKICDIKDNKDNKHKIDILSIKCKTNDINDHLKYILENHLKDKQFKYRKISIISIDDEKTNHKYIERSLVDNRTFIAENAILHNQPTTILQSQQIHHITSILDEYFFDIINNDKQYENYLLPSDEFAMPAFTRSDSSVF